MKVLPVNFKFQLSLLLYNMSDILSTDMENLVLIQYTLNNLDDHMPHLSFRMIQSWNLGLEVACPTTIISSRNIFTVAAPLSNEVWCFVLATTLTVTLGFLGIKAGYKKLLGRLFVVKW